MIRSKAVSRLSVLAMAAAMTVGMSRARAAAPLSTTDQQYLSQATEEVLGEASLSRIADKHAKTEPVKKYAHDMISGAERMEKELHAEADKHNYVLPSKDEWAKANDARLHQLENSPDFDKAYLDEQIKDHQEMIKLWNKAAEKVDLASLKQWFTDKAADLQSQLDRATALRDKAG
ncbi:MAG: DUF4142 domain-containing protein [Phycisphaerae bacterium]|nr:DUF4142 domain-containing protein [Phycisphaerae bacterium]